MSSVRISESHHQQPRCIDFLVPHTSHAHPRVRYSAFTAVGQTAYDHDPYVAESPACTLTCTYMARKHFPTTKSFPPRTHAETVLPLILSLP